MRLRLDGPIVGPGRAPGRDDGASGGLRTMADLSVGDMSLQDHAALTQVLSECRPLIERADFRDGECPGYFELSGENLVLSLQWAGYKPPEDIQLDWIYGLRLDVAWRALLEVSRRCEENDVDVHQVGSMSPDI